GHQALAVRTKETERRAICDEGHREARRMHDEAGAAAEDSLELVLARGREAPVAALLEADELLVAEVPAAWPLVEIAADGTLIAHLRRADFYRGGRDRRVHARDIGMLREIHHLDGRAEAQ